LRRTIGIIDYGAGNLSSVQRAFHALGHRARVTDALEVLEGADLLVLPGVGAYPHAMEQLAARGLDRYVCDAAREGRPLLGICLGMQLLVEESEEQRLTAGLGLIPGRVTALGGGGWHIGWNRLEVTGSDPMFRPSDRESVYFNHSFAVEVPAPYRVAVARAEGALVAAIRRDRIVGLQFHPEKSQAAGRALLDRIVQGLTAP
jgi:imidazole glycerol phosphate synthase glutamine amidotransferase subunit